MLLLLPFTTLASLIGCHDVSLLVVIYVTESLCLPCCHFLTPLALLKWTSTSGNDRSHGLCAIKRSWRHTLAFNADLTMSILNHGRLIMCELFSAATYSKLFAINYCFHTWWICAFCVALIGGLKIVFCWMWLLLDEGLWRADAVLAEFGTCFSRCC